MLQISTLSLTSCKLNNEADFDCALITFQTEVEMFSNADNYSLVEPKCDRPDCCLHDTVSSLFESLNSSTAQHAKWNVRGLQKMADGDKDAMSNLDSNLTAGTKPSRSGQRTEHPK